MCITQPLNLHILIGMLNNCSHQSPSIRGIVYFVFFKILFLPNQLKRLYHEMVHWCIGVYRWINHLFFEQGMIGSTEASKPKGLSPTTIVQKLVSFCDGSQMIPLHRYLMESLLEY